MTVDEIIDRFGGTAATARRFGVLPSAVSNWRAFGEFPDRLHLKILREAKKAGFKVPMRVFEEKR